jgi:hypothetical protein
MVDWYSLESNPYVDDGGPTPTRGPIHLPLATRAHPTNEMSISVRLFWIVTIAAGAALSAGMYLAGLESLGRMIRGM